VTTVAFAVLAVVAVLTGYAVFRVDSMARATFALALSFVAVGGVLLLLDLDYLGVVVVVMMVMEMGIMAVFMIMYMMNPAGLMPMSMWHDKGMSPAGFIMYMIMKTAMMPISITIITTTTTPR